MAEEGKTVPPVVEVLKPAKEAPAVRKDRPSMLPLPVSGSPRLRLINVGTDHECWQCNAPDYEAVRAAASRGELGGLSIKDGVVMFAGLEVSATGGS